jgi:hypothetical protein
VSNWGEALRRPLFGELCWLCIPFVVTLAGNCIANEAILAKPQTGELRAAIPERSPVCWCWRHQKILVAAVLFRIDEDVYAAATTFPNQHLFERLQTIQGESTCPLLSSRLAGQHGWHHAWRSRLIHSRADRFLGAGEACPARRQ